MPSSSARPKTASGYAIGATLLFTAALTGSGIPSSVGAEPTTASRVVFTENSGSVDPDSESQTPGETPSTPRETAPGNPQPTEEAGHGPTQVPSTPGPGQPATIPPASPGAPATLAPSAPHRPVDTPAAPAGPQIANPAETPEQPLGPDWSGEILPGDPEAAPVQPEPYKENVTPRPTPSSRASAPAAKPTSSASAGTQASRPTPDTSEGNDAGDHAPAALASSESQSGAGALLAQGIAVLVLGALGFAYFRLLKSSGRHRGRRTAGRAGGRS